MGGHGLELVRTVGELETREFVDVLQGNFVISLRRVDAVADSRAANGQLHQVLETLLDNLVAMLQLREVSGEFVA